MLTSEKNIRCSIIGAEGSYKVRLGLPIFILYTYTPRKRQVREPTMNADGAFANTFLKKVREEKSEIHNILVAYSTKHHFDVYKLPSHLVWFRPEEDMITATKSLQHRYHICLIQEFEILIATNDRAALHEYLTKIQCTIREIEKYIFHYRKTGYFLPIPPCLLSCYVRRATPVSTGYNVYTRSSRISNSRSHCRTQRMHTPAMSRT